jgi:thioredoxin-dependent peroxiredoxin
MTLEIGDNAPAFVLPTQEGQSISLESLKGHKVVLYFYPKDDTSGCTAQAIDFSQQKPAFDAADTVVLGVSKDSLKSHDKFRDKHALTIALGSDEAGSVVEAYGAWVEKSMYGKKYMGIDRSTFLIDRHGKLAQIWRKVKVPGHVQAVLKAAQTLA